MASEKISALGALGGAPTTADLLPMVDVSDTTMAASGTTKKMTVQNLIDGLGAVTGSGTINRVAKFTAAGIVGNSQITDDGSGVGVGYTSPIANQVSINTYTAIGHNTSNVALLQTRSNGSDDAFRAENTSGVLGLVIKANNRVGVGINLPTARVEINGEGLTNSTFPFIVANQNGEGVINTRDDKFVGINSNNFLARLEVRGDTVGETIFRATNNFGLFGDGLLLVGKTASGWEINIGANLASRLSSLSALYINRQNVRGSFAGSIISWQAGGTPHGIATNLTVSNAFDLYTSGVNDKFVFSYGNEITHTAHTMISAAGVVIGATTIDASARLQINSTTQGVLFPRMTTAQKNAIATPAAGLVVYDTTLAKLCVYTTAWETITSV